ncbi:MAG: hypothetical protein JOZ80_18585 [Acidobacteriaceae bacterium]|nr:hypothetical protein [Acidobacteriaceae bacterium]
MTKQKSPHTQTEQDTKPEQTDLEAGEEEYEADSAVDQQIYRQADGAETGEDRAPRKIETRNVRHRVEPEVTAHEGSTHTRSPRRPSQGITSHSANEESTRQEKVVNERPDAQAGVNRSK